MEVASAANVPVFPPPTRHRTPTSTVMSGNVAVQRTAISISEQVFHYFPIAVGMPAIVNESLLYRTNSRSGSLQLSRNGGKKIALRHCRERNAAINPGRLSSMTLQDPLSRRTKPRRGSDVKKFLSPTKKQHGEGKEALPQRHCSLSTADAFILVRRLYRRLRSRWKDLRLGELKIGNGNILCKPFPFRHEIEIHFQREIVLHGVEGEQTSVRWTNSGSRNLARPSVWLESSEYRQVNTGVYSVDVTPPATPAYHAPEGQTCPDN